MKKIFLFFFSLLFLVLTIIGCVNQDDDREAKEHNLLLQNSRHETLYRISDLYDIRQNMNSDFTFFINPLLRNYLNEIYNIKDYIVCCYDFHMDIYDKKNEFWQVYTLSDGFKPFKKIISVSMYEDHFAIIGTGIDVSNTNIIVNVFDIKNLKVFNLMHKDYLVFKENKIKIEYVDTKSLWTIDGLYKINCQDLYSGQKTNFSLLNKNLNYYPKIIFKNKKLYGVNGSSIIFSDDDIKKDQSNSFNSLYSGPLNGVTFHNDILVCQDSIVTIIDHNDHKIVKRLNLKQKVKSAIIEEDIIYCRYKNNFFIINTKNDSLIYKIKLNNNITRIFKKESIVFLITKVGISKFNINRNSIQHFLENSLYSPSSEGCEGSYRYIGDGRNDYNISVLGELGESLILLNND